MSASSWGIINKYEYLTGAEVLPSDPNSNEKKS